MIERFLPILSLSLLLALAACSNNGAEQEECIPDSTFCEQNTVRKCTVDGTASVLVEVCDVACNAGQCVTFAPGDSTGEDGTTPLDQVSPEDQVEPGCTDECAPEDFYCVGIKEIHYCIEGPDGCRVWDEGTSCDDGNPCTDDACAAEKGCVTADNKEPCDDGNPCTGPDQCGGGECQPGEMICACEQDEDCADQDDGNACNGVLVCVDNECVIEPGSVVECAGQVGPCLENVCDPETGNCLDKWIANGTACNDSNACTANETCQQGSCTGSSINCDDGNPCTDDDCNTQSGCVHENLPDGTSCGGNMECQGGVCQQANVPVVLASGLDSPHDLAIDDTWVYFIEDDSDEGTVKKVPKSGGNVVTLATLCKEPMALTVDGSNVYWLERNNGSNGRLRKVSKGGGAVTDLSTDLHNAQNHLVEAGGYLYFGDGKSGGGGVIKKVGVNGGVTVLVEGNGLLNLNTAVDVHNGNVYFRNDYDKVLRVSTGGGAVTELGSGEPSSLFVTDSYILFTEYSNGNVKRMPLNGGPAVNVATNTYGAGDLVVDGSYVYWIVNNNPGAVKRAAVLGGDEKTYSTQANSLGLAVDADYVYYGVSVFINQGKIMRAPK